VCALVVPFTAACSGSVVRPLAAWGQHVCVCGAVLAPAPVPLWVCDMLPPCRRGLAEAHVCLNGEPLAEGVTTVLSHNDRLLIGDATYFRFCDGRPVDRSDRTPGVGLVFDWQFANDECEVWER
jgi:hypothetical protein